MPFEFLNKIRNRLFPGDEAGRDDVIDAIVDTAGEEDYGSSAGPSLYPLEADYIDSACRRMKACGSARELLAVTGEEILKYSLMDLTQLYNNFSAKTGVLEKGYRDKLLKKVHEQIFDAHHDAVRMFRNPETCPDRRLNIKFADYCDMVAEACRRKSTEKSPRGLFLKYLLAAYTMFVMNRPAHPPGTPFPGGQIVDEIDGLFYCPVRDMADDVPFALCPFCPALQADGALLKWSRDARKKLKKKEYIQNYWTDFKG